MRGGIVKASFAKISGFKLRCFTSSLGMAAFEKKEQQIQKIAEWVRSFNVQKVCSSRVIRLRRHVFSSVKSAMRLHVLILSDMISNHPTAFIFVC